MKLIFNNYYIQSFSFESFREFSTFVENQKVQRKLVLDQSSGNRYYCYIGYDSLTKGELFLITFSAYQKENDLNVLMWPGDNGFVMDTGSYVYFVDKYLKIKAPLFGIMCPLIGLHLTRGNNLLVLEEASVRVISQDGEILKNEQFDAIEDFSIDNEFLFLRVQGETKKIKIG